MDNRAFVIAFIISLIFAFVAFMFVTNRKMVVTGAHDAISKKASQEREAWSLKKRRTTTVKRSN